MTAVSEVPALPALTRRSFILDACIAVGLGAVSIVSQWLVEPGMWLVPGWEGPQAWTMLMAAAATLPLAARRVWPTPVFAVVGLVSFATAALGVPDQGIGLLVAMYTVAAYRSRAMSYLALGIVLAGSAAVVAFLDAWSFAPMNFVSIVAIWGFGHRTQTLRCQAAELRRRAEELERQREERARLAVTSERARIARELHDVIAHWVSVMVVQASGAGRIARSDPDRAERAIEQVVATGRDSLQEMRRLVGLLRDGDDPLAPQPGLEALPELVDDLRRAGVPVELLIQGTQHELPAGVDLSAYRIVQEALTNVLKHAPGASAVVRIRYLGDAVEVEVADDGPGPRAGAKATSGHGLAGMGERAALVGGTVEHGGGADGYRVRAMLPLDGMPAGREHAHDAHAAHDPLEAR